MSALTDRNATTPQWRLLNAAALVAVLVAVVVVRSYYVARYATELPFWDQWDADIRRLYKPFVEGDLGWLDLFAAHNEHRIFFTRALGLLLFVANERQFDNVVVAFANTFVYAAMLAAFAAPCLREPGRRSPLPVVTVLAVIGCLPYGWENISIGFQNGFYFCALWAAIALRALVYGRGWRAIAASFAAALCGLFTMAAGLLVAPVLAIVAVLRYRNGGFSGRQLAAAIATAATVLAIGVAIYPSMAQHGNLRPAGIAELVSTTLLALSWPAPGGWGWLALPLIWWPCALWAWRSLQRSRSPMPALDVFLFGVASWTALIAIAIAAARGHGLTEIASRYTETLVLGYAANLLLAVRIVQTLPGPRRIVTAAGASIVVSTAMLFVGLYIHGVTGAAYLSARGGAQYSAQGNIAAFLNGAGDTALLGKSPGEISYPYPQPVIELLSDPSVRRILPPAARVPLRVEWPDCALVSSPGTFPTTPSLAMPSFGTYSPVSGDTNLGRCVSAPVQATRSHVRIFTAGYLNRAELRLSLRSATGDAEVPLRRTVQDAERWGMQEAALPAPRFIIVVDDANPTSWFALGAPVEEGRLSALASDLALWLRGYPIPVP